MKIKYIKTTSAFKLGSVIEATELHAMQAIEKGFAVEYKAEKQTKVVEEVGEPEVQSEEKPSAKKQTTKGKK